MLDKRLKDGVSVVLYMRKIVCGRALVGGC